MPVMSFKDLSAPDRDFLSGLLYRVGVWIGQAEDVEGENDDHQEYRALRQILESLAGPGAPNAFVRDSARHTLESDERWPEWAEDTFDIIPDAVRARGIFRQVLPKADADQFAASLCEIAAGVAEAYGEFAGDEDVSEGFLARIIGRIRDRIEGVEAGAMNVSPAESEALEDLESALKAE